MVQVLTEAGFHVEHVASSLTGVFGISGNTNVFVASDQFESAEAFDPATPS